MSKGKSLEEIWEKFQTERKERLLNEKLQEKHEAEVREKARQEYLKRIRMYENISLFSNVTTSSSAGGTTYIKRQGSDPDPKPTVKNPSTTIFYVVEDGQFSFFLQDYSNNSMTGIINIELPETYTKIGDKALTMNRGDFIFVFETSVDMVVVCQINSKGEFKLKEVNGSDIQSALGSDCFILIIDGVNLHIFRQSNDRLYTFNNNIAATVDTLGLVISTYSGEYVSKVTETKNGIVVREDLGDYSYNFHFIKGLEDPVSTGSLLYNGMIISKISDIIVFRDYPNNEMHIYKEGVFKNIMVGIVDPFDISFLSEDSFVIYTSRYGDDYKVSYYTDLNGHNSISNKIYDSSYEIGLQIANQKTSNLESYDYVNEGAAVFVFYKNGTSGGASPFTYYSEIIFLPIWSTDLSIENREYIYTDSVGKGLSNSFAPPEYNVSFNLNKDYINILVDDNESDDTYKILRLNRTGEPTSLLNTSVVKEVTSIRFNSGGESRNLNFTLLRSGGHNGNVYKFSVFNKEGGEFFIEGSHFYPHQIGSGNNLILVRYVDIYEETYIVNNLTGNEFQKLNDFYTFDYGDSVPSSYITEDNISNGNILLFGDNKVIITTNDSISKNIEVDDMENATYYLGGNGLVIKEGDKYSIYNLGGDFIDSIELPGINPSSVEYIGERFFMNYDKGGNHNILTFDGEKFNNITFVNTESTLNILHNDYSKLGAFGWDI